MSQYSFFINVIGFKRKSGYAIITNICWEGVVQSYFFLIVFSNLTGRNGSKPLEMIKTLAKNIQFKLVYFNCNCQIRAFFYDYFSWLSWWNKLIDFGWVQRCEMVYFWVWKERRKEVNGHMWEWKGKGESWFPLAKKLSLTEVSALVCKNKKGTSEKNRHST